YFSAASTLAGSANNVWVNGSNLLVINGGMNASTSIITTLTATTLNASSSIQTNATTTGQQFLSSLQGKLLATDGNGMIVATSSPIFALANGTNTTASGNQINLNSNVL